jgi:hypothetical protein
MYKSRLFSILQTFDKQDWISFGKYLISQSNEDSDPQKLYAYIEKHKNNLSHPRLEAAKTNETLFPKMNAKSFRNILSRLNVVLLEYIAIDEMQRDSRNSALFTIEGLNRRGVYNYASSQKEKYTEQLNAEILNLWTPWYRHRLLHQLKYSDNPQKYGKNSPLLNEIMHTFQEVNDRFRSFYQLDTTLIQQVDPDGLLEETLQLINYKNVKAKPQEYTNLMAQLILLNTTSSEEIYYELKARIMHVQLAQEEQIICYTYLRRYLTKKIGEGAHYLQEYADLTLWAIDRGIMLHEGKISPIRYINIVELLSAAARWKRLDELIPIYGSLLKDENQDEVINLALATKYTWQLEPKEALDYLNRPFSAKRSLKISHRRLQLLNYLTLYHNNFDFMDVQINNFQSLLTREHHKNQISELIYANNKNLCNLMQQIINNKLTKVEELNNYAEGLSSRNLLIKITKSCGLIS